VKLNTTRAVESLKDENWKVLGEGAADCVIEIDDQIDVAKEQQRQFSSNKSIKSLKRHAIPALR
jgi:hypothetical protein